MATFDETQIADFVEVFEMDSDKISQYLAYVATLITDADKAKALEILAKWQAVQDKFVSIEPNLKNFGSRIEYGKNRASLARRLAASLHITEYVGMGGNGQTRLVRG